MHTLVKSFVKRGIFHLLLAFAAFVVVNITNVAYAHGGCPCSEVSRMHSDTRSEVCDCYKDRMDKHEQWMIDEFWKKYMEPALKGQAAQQSQGQATQMQAQSAVVDAQSVIDTKRDREVQMVQTARRYSGAEQAICTPASIIQSMGATAETARAAASNWSRGAIVNETGSTDGRSFNGPANSDLKRFNANAPVYCDPKSAGGLAQKLGCNAPDRTKDLDINMIEVFFGRDLSADGKITNSSDFNIDYTFNSDEEKRAVVALMDNIGYTRSFSAFQPGKVEGKYANRAKLIENRKREILARRSIAKMSFAEFKSLFDEGTDAATQYMRGLLEEQQRENPQELVPNNPSMYLQQKIAFFDYYNDPKRFIADYGSSSPENVTRASAISLATLNVQLWNIYNVLLRMEQNLAVANVTALDGPTNTVEQEISDLNAER